VVEPVRLSKWFADDCFLSGQSEVQKVSPAALVRKSRILRNSAMFAPAFSADFGESGATFQRAAVDHLDCFRLVHWEEFGC
jgi:hypothetical protein